MARNTPAKSSGKARSTSGKARRGSTGRKAAMPFDRQNYVLLIIFVSLIVIGYVIMRLDNQVDGFVSLYVAPITLFIGYMGVFYAVMKRPKDKAAEDSKG